MKETVSGKTIWVAMAAVALTLQGSSVTHAGGGDGGEGKLFAPHASISQIQGENAIIVQGTAVYFGKKRCGNVRFRNPEGLKGASKLWDVSRRGRHIVCVIHTRNVEGEWTVSYPSTRKHTTHTKKFKITEDDTPAPGEPLPL